MRHIIKGMAGLAGILALAAPITAQAAPDAATVRDMACFIMMTKLATMPQADGKQQNPEGLRLSAAYFAGKIATRYPGKNIALVVTANRDPVNAVLAKPDPKACLNEVQIAMGPPTGATGSAKPK